MNHAVRVALHGGASDVVGDRLVVVTVNEKCRHRARNEVVERTVAAELLEQHPPELVLFIDQQISLGREQFLLVCVEVL